MGAGSDENSTSGLTPRLCNPKPFKDQFERDHQRAERRYCFILGAGASIRSGIPGGQFLAKRWMEEIHARECPAPSTGGKGTRLADWYRSSTCLIQGIDPDNPGRHYPQLFQHRYPHGDPEGQRFIQEAMRGATGSPANIPSVGYAYLALLLTKTRSRIVITTNFDNLAADALLQFTGSLPRVVGHEHVAEFASIRDGQPLIAKIHGDVGFVTANDPAGVARLPAAWAGPLRHIFRDHIPIVIGYDGNDGSLMDFLVHELVETDGQGRRRSLLRSGIYWCYVARPGRDWQARLQANARLRAVAAVHQLYFVPISDFDLWMMELGEAVDVGDPEQILVKSTRRRVDTLRDQVRQARSKQGEIATDEAVEESRSDTREKIGRRHTKWELVYAAELEPDLESANARYHEALSRHPEDPDVLGNYAVFLATRRKADDLAEKYYLKALEADPNHATNLGNYALFLATRHKGDDLAEKYYLKALEADPNHATNLGNYALFLQTRREADDLAEEYYQNALAADPNHAHNLGNYAVFLATRRKADDLAEKYYLKALEADPSRTVNLGNYAEFLVTRDRRQEAILLLARCRTNTRLLEVDTLDTLAALLWMAITVSDATTQRYAHLLGAIKSLVSQPTYTSNWDFDALIRWIESKPDDGRRELFVALAQVCAGTEPLETLDRFPEWVALAPVAPAEGLAALVDPD